MIPDGTEERMSVAGVMSVAMLAFSFGCYVTAKLVGHIVGHALKELEDEGIIDVRRERRDSEPS